jgi:hypothetical protein
MRIITSINGQDSWVTFEATLTRTIIERASKTHGGINSTSKVININRN